MRLDGLHIYRIEKWTKRWFGKNFYWKVMTFTDYGWGGDTSWFTEFSTLESAQTQLKHLTASDVEARERRLDSWMTVESA
jgi:hypothetical protein